MTEAEEVAHSINEQLSAPPASFQEALEVVKQQMDDTQSVMSAVAEALWGLQRTS